MVKHQLHIVGLPYSDVGIDLDEFFDKIGDDARLTLRPEPNNPVDALAIRAYDTTGRHVGYVAQCDKPLAWSLLRLLGRKSLRGRAAEVNREHRCVTFECEAEPVTTILSIYPKEEFTAWAYSGPLIPTTDEMGRLEYMMDEIADRLEADEVRTAKERETFMALVERFCETSKFDISGDMSDYRRRLARQLQEHDMAELSRRLKREDGHAGRESIGGEVLDYWIRVLTEPSVTRGMLESRRRYDRRAIVEELEGFPQGLYTTWCEAPELFVSRALYMHIPREVLWRLVSGIVFAELTKGEECPMRNDDGTDYPQRVTDEAIARVLVEMSGKDKAINTYKKWLGVCLLLAERYGFPRDLSRCCERIAQLPYGERKPEIGCKYENIRKLSYMKFVSVSIDDWDEYIPKADERKMFQDCQEVVREFERIINTQMRKSS